MALALPGPLAGFSMTSSRPPSRVPQLALMSASRASAAAEGLSKGIGVVARKSLRPLLFRGMCHTESSAPVRTAPTTSSHGMMVEGGGE